MLLDLFCPHCKVTFEHCVNFARTVESAEVITSCARCGATGRSAVSLDALNHATANPPITSATEAIAVAALEAVSHSEKKKSSVLLHEGIWMLAGTVIGVLVPARIWLTLNGKMLALFYLVVMVVIAVTAHKLIKSTFPNPPKQGWWNSSIMVKALAAVDRSSFRKALVAVTLINMSMVFTGLVFGYVLVLSYLILVAPRFIHG